MKIPITLLNTGIMFAIAAIHIYWAMGGKWASKAVIPARPITGASGLEESTIFRPSAFATLIVAGGLTAIGFVILNVAVQITLLENYQEILLNLIAGIFFLRAIGDFKYVGIFKKIRYTRFAKNDTRLFSPLCLWLGASLIYVNYW